jgi:hypothetical protein
LINPGAGGPLSRISPSMFTALMLLMFVPFKTVMSAKP